LLAKIQRQGNSTYFEGGSTLKTITVEAMARWTYGRLQADVFRELEDAGGWSAPSFLSRLGMPMDTGAGAIAALVIEPRALHCDARAFHASVGKLERLEREMVVTYGYDGAFPDPAECVPRPRPCAPALAVQTGSGDRRQRGDYFGQGVFEGEKVLYRLEAGGRWKDASGAVHTTASVQQFEEAVWRKRGRRVEFVGYENKRYEIWSCPLDWWPSPAWYEMVCAQAETWARVRRKLLELLEGVRMAEHVVV
jgi:hypothetical protein